MANIEASLRQARITDFQARVNLEKEKTVLHANVSIQAKKPIDSDNLSGLLLFQAVISAENKEEFFLSLTEELIFEFTEKPVDFEEITREACVPIAAREVSESIDGILKLMGHAPLNLNLNQARER
ncbi:MAG: hypothetical protein IJ617_05525 [Oscillospiraceae bacterium]|nr:hypothetical protein [Oscillospiraceae bacterium]